MFAAVDGIRPTDAPTGAPPAGAGRIADGLVSALRTGADARDVAQTLRDLGQNDPALEDAVRGALEARLTPVEQGEMARADAMDAALRAGGGGPSDAERRAIAVAFRRELDGNQSSLRSGALSPAERSARTELQQVGERALLNIDVYEDQSVASLLPRGFTALSDRQAERQFPGFTARDNRAGLYSRIYHDSESDTYVVVNRGTDDGWAPWGIVRGSPDGSTNRGLIFGSKTRPADLALANADAVADATGGRVAFSGHSLGGALASLQGAQVGKPATVFNPLGLQEKLFERYTIDREGLDQHVRAYVVDGDPVAGSNGFFGLERAPTTQLPSRDLSWSANDGLRSSDNSPDEHGMVSVIGGLLHRANAAIREAR